MKFNTKKANHIFIIFLTLLFISSLFQIDEDLSLFIHEYFTTFFLVYLLSLSFIIYYAMQHAQQKRTANKVKLMHEKDFIHKINKLSYNEKNILSLFINSKSEEKSLNHSDSAVCWLENVKFIYNTGKSDGHKKIFKIHPDVSKYLTDNPNSLY